MGENKNLVVRKQELKKKQKQKTHYCPLLTTFPSEKLCVLHIYPKFGQM